VTLLPERMFDRVAAWITPALPSQSQTIPTRSAASSPPSPPRGDPPISAARNGQTVLTFESVTAELMLRSRVMQAIEVAAGPDWQAVARPVS
jgi:hypothetical protein